jgi:GTPase SAR1 family protein
LDLHLFLAAEQTVETLTMEIQRAHMVCVVYVVDDESLRKVSPYWLPLSRDIPPSGPHRPVVLVGNKTDLVDYSTAEVRCLALSLNVGIYEGKSENKVPYFINIYFIAFPA